MAGGVTTSGVRRLRARALLVGVAGLALASPAALRAQAADSAAALRRLHDAQRRFETVRRMHLPLTEARGRRECDATIGPYCYWYDPHEAPHRPPESPRVAAARRELLRVLDSLGAQWPSSAAVAGQRVRYRVDGADTTGADRIATAGCRADGWWCSALAGFARHVAGDFPGAAAAFDRALALMSAQERCEWADLSPLLPGEARRRFGALACPAREREARRILWLATPLLAHDANDFRTEYFARRVAAELEAADPVMFGQRWNAYAEEMLLRFGRQEWWTRERPAAIGSTARPHIVGHERVPSFAFLPAERLLRDSTRVPEPADWSPAAALPPARYAPAYAQAWRELRAQVARFRRGDSLLVLAAYDAAGDTLLAAPRATLAVSSGPAGPTWRATQPQPGATGTVRVLVPARALGEVALASLELVEPATLTVARHRTGIQRLPVQRIAVSDLLLHHPAPSPAGGVADFESAARRALPDHTIRANEVGVYWETYDAGGGAMRTLTLTVERTDRSLLARVAARLGAAGARQPIRIRWREAAGAGSGHGRSVTVRLRDLPDGEYLLRLGVERDDGARATTSRAVTLRR